MNLIVNKTELLNGQVVPPGSKSQSIRAILLASLSQGESVLTNMLHSDDTRDAITACRLLGMTISDCDHVVTIQSQGLPLNPPVSEILSGNSGITTHFLMPLLGLRKEPEQAIILNCKEQMRARPIQSFVETLKQLGLRIEYIEQENKLPIRISGKLVGGKASVDGVTSQYLSALLLALPCADNDSEITVKNLQERSYAEMTMQWLEEQAIQFEHRSSGVLDSYFIKGKQHYKPIYTTIPGDFSSASYLIAAATLIPSNVILKGLNMADPQGDKRLIPLLQEMGADIEILPNQIHIRGGKKLTGIKIDANDIPDLLPTLAVIATFASGKTEIHNVAHARIKETDRIHSMQTGLTAMGAKIVEHDDGLTVYQSTLKGANVKGYGDHRTVMALALAGMLATDTTVIDDFEAINKTFPTFVSLMQSLGAKMEVSHATLT